MRRARILSVCLALAALAWAPIARDASARQTLTLRPVPESRMWVDGTSNRSDWTVEAKAISGTVVMNGSSVTSIVVEIPAERIESTVSRIMDRLMYKTLKSSQHGIVTFRVAAATPMVDGTNGSSTLSLRGDLTIAGVTKEVSFPATGIRDGSGGWRFQGQVSMLLTDFGMEPPTALFGALHTGDEVTIRFDVVAGL